ncbi:MAG: thioredoxin-like domain-containing protein [Syntrophothermus sp.]
MRKSFIFILLILGIQAFAGNSYVLKGRISGLDRQKVFLLSIYGERTTKVDSVISDSLGRLTFNLPEKLPVGLYRLMSGKDLVIDLILNHENVEFQTSFQSVADSLRFLASAENRLYYFYMQLDRKTQQKLELLTPVLDFYPDNDRYYQETAAHYEQMQKELQHVLDSLKHQYPEAFAIRIFNLQKTPFLPAALKKNQRLDYLKNHYLDNIDFSDTLLLHSNAWSNKAISYLSLYSNNRFTQPQLEAEFIRGVTAILSAASVNPYIFKFLLDYYVGGFDKYHFDDVIEYMADNFQDPFACEDQTRKSVLQKKLDNFKKISVGKDAPELKVTDKNGKDTDLYKIRSEYTLVVFWSSECSHCVEMMPKLKTFYDKQKPKRVEVMAVSLDTNQKSWLDFIRENKFNWIDVSDLKGFAGKAADDYNIYATPTMFLLDKDKKIVAKPVSYRELELNLSELGLNK